MAIGYLFNADVRAVEEPAPLQEDFPETEGANQTARILLHMADSGTNLSGTNSINHESPLKSIGEKSGY
jgi:hypothetical protein